MLPPIVGFRTDSLIANRTLAGNSNGGVGFRVGGFAAQALVVYPCRMKNMFRLLLLLVAGTALAACQSVADPFTLLNVTGTVTQAGSPAAARITLTAGGNQNEREFPDGSYSITTGGGGIPESLCSEVRIAAGLLSPEGTVVDTQTRTIGACGDQVVNFEFP